MKNLFSKLFQKSEVQKNLNVKDLNIDISQTSEKFQYMATEIVDFLLSNLQKLDKIEDEIFKRYEALKAKRTSPNQVHSDEESLWAEYAQRCEKIIRSIGMENYDGSSRTFENPTKYHYFNDPQTKITFIMKSENRAVVETEFEAGIRKKEKFTLKKEESSWKIDTKKYGFPDEDKWSIDEI